MSYPRGVQSYINFLLSEIKRLNKEVGIAETFIDQLGDIKIYIKLKESILEKNSSAKENNGKD